MDKNERLSFLETRNVNEATKRVIDSVITQYSALKQGQVVNSGAIFDEQVRAVKNMLFLKYTCIEFESVFQKMYVDNKFTT